jgi:hypothetical protein
MQPDLISYNYILLDPRKAGQYTYEGLNFSLLYEPYYVGKGKKNRMYGHFQDYSLKDDILKNRKIKSLLKLYTKSILRQFVIQVNKNISNTTANEKEIQIIKAIGRIDLKSGSLCNLSDGGDGNNMSPTLKQNLREKHLALNQTPDYIHPKKGRPVSLDTRQLQSERATGRTMSNETKIKRAATTTGKPQKHSRKIILVSPDKVEYECFGNFRITCESLNINYRTMVNLLRGKYAASTIKGWSIYYKD